MGKPKFITFEGGEGVGKSTQAKYLSRAFEAKRISVILTREPGGSVSAEYIRNLLVSGEVNRWQPETEVFLHYAARIEHVLQLIKPALDEGKWVISDRFLDSTMAYQGYGFGLDHSRLNFINAFALGEFKPDFTILLDIPIAEGKTRVQARGAGENRYERLSPDFHERVRKGFLRMSASEPKRFVVIDAAQNIDTVRGEVLESVNKKFRLDLF